MNDTEKHESTAYKRVSQGKCPIEAHDKIDEFGLCVKCRAWWTLVVIPADYSNGVFFAETTALQCEVRVFDDHEVSAVTTRFTDVALASVYNPDDVLTYELIQAHERLRLR